MATEPIDSFSLILVGTGFASSFFLYRYLQRCGSDARILVLERGEMRQHRWQIEHADILAADARRSFTNHQPRKPWNFRLAFGGASNCWWACTPRFLPQDFQLRSRYGVGQDWPVSYDDLEAYYCEAEEVMAVSGPADRTPFPRSRPYPQPPHRLSEPDRLLKRHFPEAFFNQPTARPSRSTSSGRPRCCASGVCAACPINSKFTILNELKYLYDDPRVTLILGATVSSLDIANSLVSRVRYRLADKDHEARGEVVGLGANALFNPHILMRSGLDDPQLGRGLVEQISALVDVHLDGLDNFQGSTSITGHGYMLYDGAHRKERAGALIETYNMPELRNERGKWRRRLKLNFIFEDLRQDANRVTFNPARPDTPEVSYLGPSAYAQRGRQALAAELSSILAALPVESYRIDTDTVLTQSHILGTAVMGTGPADSVVDAAMVHHRIRNLLVLGGSAFPTTSPANPTLTMSALSLRAADKLMARQ